MIRFPRARPFSVFGVAATVAVGVLAAASAADGQPSYTVLRSFTGTPLDGAYPAPLLQAVDGTLYGTTLSGGFDDLGTVFQMARDGSGFTLLHSFSGPMDGANPADLIQGPDGTLYGTAEWGGPGNRGVVFQMNPDGRSMTTWPASESDSATGRGSASTTIFRFHRRQPRTTCRSRLSMHRPQP